MFKIEYAFASNSFRDIAGASETELRFILFQGSIILKTENNSILIDWDWVPLLDFASSLLAIGTQLSKNKSGEEEFEFTESDERILFKKEGQRVIVSTSFSNEMIEVYFEEFFTEIKQFYKDIIFEILSKEKLLGNNRYFFRYLSEVEKL